MQKTPLFQAWLQMPDGSKLRVGREGITIGRRADSHLIVTDPRTSLKHCHVSPVPGGLEITPLGRNPTRVNSTIIPGRTQLLDGDVVELPGISLQVMVEEIQGSPVSGWRLVRQEGIELSIRPLPFQIGGGKDDHIVVPDTPECCIVFHGVDTGIAIEVRYDVKRNGKRIQAGTITSTLPGDRWTIGEAHFHVTSDEFDPEQTQLIGFFGATEVRFTFLVEGGRLDFRLNPNTAMRSILLPEMRARLIATLLKPPGEYQAGEDIPDEVLIPSIWPGQKIRNRTDLNQLIHRTRKDLVKAGVDPHAVLERVGRVGATRFRLAADATVHFGD